MKLLCGSIVLLAVSFCCYGQANKVIDLPTIAPAQAYVVGDGGQSIATDLPALEIIEIKVDGKSVGLGRPFSAGVEWLKTLAIKVKNISQKRIASVRISFALPEAKNSDGVISGFSLQYGKELGTGINFGVQNPIEPNQEVELQRNEAHYSMDRDGIKRRTGMSDFNTVLIANTVVRFEDGTSWLTYKLPIASSQTTKN